MKILHVVNSMELAGAEKLLSDLIPIFNQVKDVKCDLLVFKSKNEILLENLKKHNSIKVYELGFNNIYNPLIILKLLKYFKEYDIIHSHLFPAQYFVAFSKLFSQKRVKLIFTEHNTSNRRLQNSLISYFNKFVYSIYDKTICIADEIQEFYIKYTNLDESCFPLIYNGIDLKKIISADKIDLDKFFDEKNDQSKFLVQVSSFTKQKDQNTLIKALKYLPNYFKIILIGVGPLIEISQKIVNDLGLSNRVVFLGLRNDVPNFLVSSDYNLLSTNFEGMSLSCIEGMSSGNPFLASDAPGVRNLVEGYGVLFPIGDSKKIAEEIMKLESNCAYKKKVIDKCIERAKQYEIDLMATNYMNLYKELT